MNETIIPLSKTIAPRKNASRKKAKKAWIQSEAETLKMFARAAPDSDEAKEIERINKAPRRKDLYVSNGTVVIKNVQQKYEIQFEKGKIKLNSHVALAQKTAPRRHSRAYRPAARSRSYRAPTRSSSCSVAAHDDGGGESSDCSDSAEPPEKPYQHLKSIQTQSNSCFPLAKVHPRLLLHDLRKGAAS